MRIYTGVTIDTEFENLRVLGYSGTINDKQFAALRAEGLLGALPDMFGQFSGAGEAAVLSNLAYAADQISVDTTVASGTIYYLLHSSVTPLAAADIKADVLDLSAVGGGTLDASDTENQPVDWTGVTPDTYWLNMVQESAGGFSNVVFLEITILSAFDPASIAHFVWDASDTASLWQNTAGSTAVTTTGDPVARIDNIGSLGGTFLNTGATDRPIYTVSGGQSYLQFDGSNDYLSWIGTAGDINYSAGFYLILGIEETGTAAVSKGWVTGAGAAGNSYNSPHGFMLNSGDTTTNAAWMLAGLANAAGHDMLDTGGSSMPLAIIEVEATAATGSTNGWLRVRRVSDGDVVEKATDAASSGGFPDDAVSLSSLMLGATFSSGSPVEFANCRIYCGAMRHGTVTAQNKTDMRAWVAGKIGF